LGSDPNVLDRFESVDPTIECEYNLRVRHPEREAVYNRFATDSGILRENHPGFTSLRYGDSPNSLIDFFPAVTGKPAPVFVFLHGGYWRALDRRIFSFLARPWLARGVHVALPGYDLVPAQTLREIANQARNAIEWLIKRSAELNLDAARLVIGGHSAGAHLAALSISGMTDRSAIGFVGVSGVYDLPPLLRTSVNLDLQLDHAEAHALSPLRRHADPRLRYLCAVGGAETDGFRRQSANYASMLCSHGCVADYLEVPNRTHFDVLDDLADPDTALFQAAWATLPPQKD
jgi:arylformamidase